MNVLLTLVFETGEPDLPYWTIHVVVNANQFDSDELEDCFASYYDSDASDDKDFEEATEEVLNSFGWDWHFVKDEIPACESVYTMWI